MIAKLIFAGAAAGLFTAGGAFATTYDYTLLKAPDTQFTVALGINDSGAVTGWDTTATAEFGFVYPGRTYTKLSYPGASFTEAERINDSAQ
jgi:hypothetical protein